MFLFVVVVLRACLIVSWGSLFLSKQHCSCVGVSEQHGSFHQKVATKSKNHKKMCCYVCLLWLLSDVCVVCFVLWCALSCVCVFADVVRAAMFVCCCCCSMLVLCVLLCSVLCCVCVCLLLLFVLLFFLTTSMR